MSYFMLIVLLILGSVASSGVKRTFKKYHMVRSSRNITGAEAAEMMLRKNGIYDVKVQQISGDLTDHYDPRNKVIRLSEPVYNNPSVSAVSVACHEVGHAIQHANNYTPLKFREKLLPAVNLGSKAFFPLFFAGIFLGIEPLRNLGIVFFSFSVIFQLITLPVEFNASSRALANMQEASMLIDGENDQAKKVLTAAAMTYVVSALMAVAQLVRFIMMGSRRD